MIVTFCGHSDFQKSEKYKQAILFFLENTIAQNPVELYFGGYGNFDKFAYDCGKIYKTNHPNTHLVFITPYISEKYLKIQTEHEKEKYDFVIYPPIESPPKKFAISYRNKYMIEKSDFVIAYIEHPFGGAYQSYKYAKRKGKIVFNLSGKNFD